MPNENTEELDAIMIGMPEAWRANWCEAGESGCACMGCANYSGGLVRCGFAKADWEAWKERTGFTKRPLDVFLEQRRQTPKTL